MSYSPKPKPIDVAIDPRTITLESAIRAANSNTPPDPEREAFDKWWDRKSAEPLNYRDIKHYAWSAWIESRHHTVATIKEKVEKL